MRNKNQRIYSNREHLLALAAEQSEYIGRQFKLDLEEGCLTIFALPQRKRRSTPSDTVERNKREEKFERRAR